MRLSAVSSQMGLASGDDAQHSLSHGFQRRLLHDLLPVGVGYVKDVNRSVPLGGDLGQSDVHVKLIQDTCEPVQQAQAVLRLQFDNRMGVGMAVVHDNMRRLHEHVGFRAPERVPARQRHPFDVPRVLERIAQDLFNALPHLQIGHGSLFEGFHVQDVERQVVARGIDFRPQDIQAAAAQGSRDQRKKCHAVPRRRW